MVSPCAAWACGFVWVEADMIVIGDGVVLMLAASTAVLESIDSMSRTDNVNGFWQMTERLATS